jgi:hypothetical protein
MIELNFPYFLAFLTAVFAPFFDGSDSLNVRALAGCPPPWTRFPGVYNLHTQVTAFPLEGVLPNVYLRYGSYI